MSQDLITILTLLLGGSGGGIMILRAILDYKTSVAAREKEFNKSVIESLKNTNAKLEEAQQKSRQWMEYSSELIGFILKRGIERSEIPRAPDEKD